MKERFSHYLKIIELFLSEYFSKIVFVVKSYFWGVQLGKRVSLCGVPIIRKTPGSLISIGDNCRFLSKFESNSVGVNRKCMFRTLNSNAKLVIGDSCGFSGVVFSCANEIIIGERVMIGANCTISDSDSHSLNYRERNPDFFNINKTNFKENILSSPIRIEDDVFIGMNSIILKGVIIGKGSVIGAGSVVTKSIPANVIAAGNPAKIIKSLI